MMINNSGWVYNNNSKNRLIEKQQAVSNQNKDAPLQKQQKYKINRNKFQQNWFKLTRNRWAVLKEP